MSRRTGTNQRSGDAGEDSAAYPHPNPTTTSSLTAPSYATSSYPASPYGALPYATPYSQQTPSLVGGGYESYQQSSVPPSGYPAQQYAAQAAAGSIPYAQSSPPQYYTHTPGSAYQQQTALSYTQTGSFPPSPPSTADDPPLTLVPSQEDYYQRYNRHASDAARYQSLPYGWPVRFEGQSTWTKDDLAGESSWFYSFTQYDKTALHYAMCHYRDSGNELLYISPDLFPVGEPLASRLRGIGNQIYNDRGIFLLRGLDLDQYDDREIVIMHAGISSYIGSQRAYQCENDNVVAHIRDRSSRLGYTGSDLAPSATSNEIGFHTDIGDIVSNLTIYPAASGGTSYFASAAQVYNELASTRKDIIHLLVQPWQFDIFPNAQVDKPSTYRPLLYNSSTHVTLLCFRRPFITTPPHNARQGNFQPISSAHKEALDTIHYTARSTAFPIKFQRGDISFVNNLRVLHARDAFQDHPSVPQRHIQRLIVRDPTESRSLPAGLEDIWRKIYGDQRTPWKNEAFRPEGSTGDALWRLNG